VAATEPVDNAPRVAAVKRKTWHKVGAAAGVALGALFLWLAVRGVDLGNVWHALSDADPWLVVAAVGALAAVYVVQAARWRVIARGASPLAHYVEFVVMGVAVNNVVPGRIGDALRGVWLARDERIATGRAMATVVLDRASDVVVLIALLIVAVPFTAHPAWLQRILIGGVLLAALAVLVVVAARIVSRAHARVERRRSAVRRFGRDLLDELAEPLGATRAMSVLALAVLAWLAWCLAAWCVARSLGIELSASELALVASVVNLGVAIPSSPGFVGTYQWLGVVSLGLVGVGAEQALAFSILLHAAWYVPTTLVGGGLLLRRSIRRELVYSSSKIGLSTKPSR
jgi:glycosyltransferase 2 family protein